MSQTKAIKQRVCAAIFTLGICLAGFHEIGCSPEQSQLANITIKQIEHLVIVKS